MYGRSVKRRGFTMIEMLTVIAMIAILAAILFPVFAQVRRRVHQTSCINNMHQISQALNLYHDTHNRYPLALDSFVANGRTFRPMSAQIKSEDVFRCPLSAYRQSDANQTAGFAPAQLTPAAMTVKRFPAPGGQLHVCVDARGGPKSLRAGNCLSGEQQVPAQFPLRDSYDGAFVPNELTRTWEAHYSRDWTEQPASISDIQRQGKFRDPPGNTVITWCLNHASIDGTGVPHGQVPVLFKDGNVKLKPGEKFQISEWTQDGGTWRVYP